MIGSVARAQVRVSIAPAMTEAAAARVVVNEDGQRVYSPRSSGAQPVALDGAFRRSAAVVALRGPHDIHASIADFVRDNQATLSRCTTPEAVAEVVARTSAAGPIDPTGRSLVERRWIGLAATQSRAAIRAQARVAALRAGLPPFAVDAVADGVPRGVARVVVGATVRRPLERAYTEALTKRNALIESTSGDTAAMKANDRLIHDMPRADLTRVDLGFTQAHIDTGALGLPPREFPFATARADTLARAAVLEAIIEDPSPSPAERGLLAAAAELARETEPDELELLSRDR